jgi:hypothetical protein
MERVKEIYEKAQRDPLRIIDEDLEFLKRSLKTKEIDTRRIKKFSMEESKTIALYSFKLCTLYVMKMLYTMRRDIFDDEVIISMYDILVLDDISTLSSECIIELAKYRSKISECILDAFYMLTSDALSKKIVHYLESQDYPERIGINFALMNSRTLDWRCEKLKILGNMEVGNELLSLVKKMKSLIRRSGLRRIFIAMKTQLWDDEVSKE